ncbi:MAG: ATP-dependent helicase [Gemmatimonadaceae bacterium]|nr:ATP-dependent helicase [Gemmatimonadaceae bacterium]
MDELPRIYQPRERTTAPSDRASLLSGLNPEQAAAAAHGDGPLLIIAGAGTGKTRTLVYRVAHLIERGIRPERILLLTFTRRAAQEMLSRAERLVGSASGRVHGGTFHATGHRLLRTYGESAGLARDFSIIDQGDAEELMGRARAQLGFGAGAKRFPKKETLHYVYSRHINTEKPLEVILGEELPQFAEYADQITRIFAEYVSRKGERNLLDYDDLLYFWATMLESSEELAQRISSLYDHVLVDEYQDTNILQARILRGMCRTHRNITVVGDDAQSIYAFRGASFRNILEFPKQFQGAAVVTLEQNYRSTQPILDVTNTLISRASERFSKTLWTVRGGGDKPWLVTARDEHEQTRFVVDRILQLHENGTPLGEIAVLFRAGYMSADLEIELANRKIPFEKWGGIKFLEAAHIKDVLSFLRVLDNPRDEISWFRILTLLPGVGEVTANNAIHALLARAWDVGALEDFVPPARARAAHGALVAMLRELRDTPSAQTGDAGPGGADEGAVARDIARIRVLYDDILRERYDRPEPRLADLDQLQTIAAGYPTRGAFLSALTLEPPSSTQDLGAGADSEDDHLVLSTAHSAKGKEWDAVFVIWAVDGWFPSSRALGDDDELEEERRLMYVAMTRARNELAIVYPLNAYATQRGSEYSIDQLSRFVDRGVRQHMQRVALGPPAPDPAAAPPRQEPLLDLRALLRGRFTP